MVLRREITSIDSLNMNRLSQNVSISGVLQMIVNRKVQLQSVIGLQRLCMPYLSLMLLKIGDMLIMWPSAKVKNLGGMVVNLIVYHGINTNSFIQWFHFLKFLAMSTCLCPSRIQCPYLCWCLVLPRNVDEWNEGRKINRSTSLYVSSNLNIETAMYRTCQGARYKEKKCRE
jgi:hypothetical protein